MVTYNMSYLETSVLYSFDLSDPILEIWIVFETVSAPEVAVEITVNTR